jgi:uncharacterized protein YprB with RNaseH-like and TPR domain
VNVVGGEDIDVMGLPDYMVLDIETISIDFEDRAVIDYLILKRTERAYHPFFAKIIAIGVKGRDEEPIIWSGDDERAILGEFWDHLSKTNPELYVTFNGIGFDIPFLTIRSIVNDIRPTVVINRNKWKMMQENHFDLMFALTDMWGQTWVKLEIMCRVMDIDIPKDAVQGYQIGDFYDKDDWESIKRHNRQDLDLTEKLFLKVRQFF